jgi:hypothetical protein
MQALQLHESRVERHATTVQRPHPHHSRLY